MNRKKNTLPTAVQDELNQIVMPRVRLALDDRQIDIVKRYRVAKEAMSQAVHKAMLNANENHAWTVDDREAVNIAESALRLSQIEMCALLDVALLAAGI